MRLPDWFLTKKNLFILVFLLIPLSAFAQESIKRPKILLWAWQRKENLEFIHPETTGVAFLAKTISIHDHSFSAKPRLQSLSVPRGVWLTAVVRIRTAQRNHPPSLRLATDISKEIAMLASLEGVSAIQIDFDARRSERAFYKELLIGVRNRLGDSYPLTITALASWCVYDNWLKELPIREAVPMFFRMGPERSLFLEYLTLGKLNPQCRQSIGISLDEPIIRLPEKSHIYIFSPIAWTEGEFNKILAEIGQ